MSENDSEKVIITTRIEKITFSRIESFKLSGKFKYLDLVNGPHQFSAQMDMMELVGSANNVDTRKNLLQSSIHVTCKYRTAVKKFSAEQLNESKICYSEMVKMAKTDDNGTATHVVTQIQYGADATFTFTKQLSKKPRTSTKKLAGYQYRKLFENPVRKRGCRRKRCGNKLRKRDGHSVPFRRRFTTSQIP